MSPVAESMSSKPWILTLTLLSTAVSLCLADGSSHDQKVDKDDLAFAPGGANPNAFKFEEAKPTRFVCRSVFVIFTAIAKANSSFYGKRIY